MISKLIALSDHLKLPPDSFDRLSPDFEDRCSITYQSADGNYRTFLVLDSDEVISRDLVEFSHELSKGFRIIEQQQTGEQQ
jgi:hypothetical protein